MALEPDFTAFEADFFRYAVSAANAHTAVVFPGFICRYRFLDEPVFPSPAYCAAIDPGSLRGSTTGSPRSADRSAAT